MTVPVLVVFDNFEDVLIPHWSLQTGWIDHDDGDIFLCSETLEETCQGKL